MKKKAYSVPYPTILFVTGRNFVVRYSDKVCFHFGKPNLQNSFFYQFKTMDSKDIVDLK